MRLHPDIQAILDVMNAISSPPAHEVPVAQARAAHVSEAERLSGPGEPVAEVRDVTVPGAGGDVHPGQHGQHGRRGPRTNGP